ncbi:MAG TPA: LCP family protein [Anaerovoracaceae bacterium]|nr:LCP family protein [Anaerovoracaceae bacterium]
MRNIDWKAFGKQFAIYFIIFTLVMIPVQLILNEIGGIRLFPGTQSIIRDMGYLVDEDSPFYNEFKNSERVNILVMGVNDGLTDTIMLASYDMKNQKIDVISVPRDTYYYREGYVNAAAHKINAIYASDGVIGTARAVSDVLLGIPINYYAVIEYDGVSKVVESMGGVPMNIPIDMVYSDPYDTPPLKINIKKGEQVLDGKTSVEYLRFRKDYAEGDIGRVGAQQLFVKAAFKQAIGKDLIKVIRTTIENVDSDLPLGMAIKIGTNALGLEAESLTTYLTPGASGTSDGASYWRTDSKEIEQMIRQIYAPVVSEE